MSSIIRVLDETTINQMAAGEVIENPSSVVKELVENAIDAGSTDITVEIKGGGRQLIRVTDNGCGMSPDDALLSLERHATSKMRVMDDLCGVGTMGFRGEAIPSVASISKFSILTRLPDQGEGTLVLVEGGKIIKTAKAPRDPGTTIEVSSLFYNVPVRKKFQFSPNYDATEIQKVMTLFALAHPEIKLELFHNQKSVLLALVPQKETFSDQLGERIATLLGDETFHALFPIAFKTDEIEVVGFLAHPHFTRQNRTGQYLFIDRRAVFSPIISRAVKEGYGTAIAGNRFPQYVLHVNLPGELVDVNVHPQKREIRFRQPYAIKEAIFKGVDRALQRAQVSFETDRVIPFPTTSPQWTNRPVYTEMVVESAPERHGSQVEISKSPALFSVEDAPLAPRVLATIKGYILVCPHSLPAVRGTTGVVFVDQRRAHARVIFENLQNREKKRLEIEPLLIPYTLEVTPTQETLLNEHLPSLHQVGLPIEGFGNGTFIVHAMPTIFGNTDLMQFMRDLLSMLSEEGSTHFLEEEMAKRVALIAGRSAVSAQKTLSTDEGKSLVKQLFQCRHPDHCPKGTPTFVYLSQENIAQAFETKGGRC